MVVYDDEMMLLRGTEDLNGVFPSLQLTCFVPNDFSRSKKIRETLAKSLYSSSKPVSRHGDLIKRALVVQDK